MLFFKRKPIYVQIQTYADWRGIKFPIAALKQRESLLFFAKAMKVDCATRMTIADLQIHYDSLPTDYGRITFINSLRLFLRYCKLVGLANIKVEIQQGTIRMEKVHSLLDVDQVLRVKALRGRVMEDGKPMSYRKIAAYMGKKDNRKYDVKNVYKWANYKLPEEYELSP